MFKRIYLSIPFYVIYFIVDPALTLHRDFLLENYNNHSQRSSFIERNRKMASTFENSLRKIKDTTQDLGRNIYGHLNKGFKILNNRNCINEDDVRQYENLVIMKKYPYLDIRELEMRYLPMALKRHSDSLYLDRNEHHEPSLNGQEDMLNIEITNRGLSGFAIPSQTPKHTEKGETKHTVEEKYIEIPDQNVLRSLKEDINAFIERKKGI